MLETMRAGCGSARKYFGGSIGDMITIVEIICGKNDEFSFFDGLLK